MSMIGNFNQMPLAVLEEIRRNPELVASIIYPENEAEDSFSIDKTWHAIHFLLTGTTWGGEPPLADTVMGGTEIGDDIGYGPARYLTPEQVKNVAEALSGVSEQDLKSRFDPVAMTAADIYPDFEGNDEDWEYVSSYFRDLVAFYKEAAAKGNAMLLYLN